MIPLLDSRTTRLRAVAARPRRHLWQAGLAIALALPQAAYPYALEQLLELPLERLLLLRVSARGPHHAP